MAIWKLPTNERGEPRHIAQYVADSLFRIIVAGEVTAQSQRDILLQLSYFISLYSGRIVTPNGMQFKRTHTPNIECSVVEDNPLFCTILVKLHQPGQSPTSILAVRAFTVDEAKNFADEEVLARGHVCNGKCTNWKPV